MACQLGLVKKVYRWAMQADHCLLCLAPVRGQLQAICSGCQLDLPWLLQGCEGCALPVPTGVQWCTACQQQPQPFAGAQCAWRYDFPVNMLIGNFKYARDWPAGRLLSELLAAHLAFLRDENGLQLAEALVPVPLAGKRWRMRGYNQAQMIADWLGKALQVPVLERAVKRVRYTQIQQGLDARQRQANMHNAFAVLQPQQVAGRHIAVVDDVLTTGATCAALTRELLAAGARRVDVYCLARTGRVPQVG